MAIPRVAVDDVGFANTACHHHVIHHRLDELAMPRIRRRHVRTRLKSTDVQVPLFDPLVPKTHYTNVMLVIIYPGELPRQIFDLLDGTAVVICMILVVYISSTKLSRVTLIIIGLRYRHD